MRSPPRLRDADHADHAISRDADQTIPRDADYTIPRERDHAMHWLRCDLTVAEEASDD
jgi:hypothetical protein